jgi:glycosyltransferase involved in cell wall biosynthesis
MSSGRPDVAVVIPTRDRWELLQQAVRSALSQRDVEAEVIVVDDASRTAPPQAVASLLAKTNFIRQESHAGVSAARNAGISRARAAWIAFLDDDDLWAPTRLADLLQEARNTGADFAYSSAIMVTEDLRPFRLHEAPDVATLLEKLRHGNVIPGGGSGVVARADLVRECGGFDEQFSNADSEDWDLWIRLADARTAAAVAEPLVAYRRHFGAWGVSRDPVAREDIDRLIRKHTDLGIEFDWAAVDRNYAYLLWWSGRRGAAALALLRGVLRNRDAGTLVRAARALLPPSTAKRRPLFNAPDLPNPEWLAAYRNDHDLSSNLRSP